MAHVLGIMSVMAVGLMVWVRIRVPDFSGLAASKRLPLGQVFTLAGVRTVLFVVLTFVLAHNIFYTYIASFLASVDMAERTDLILLVFGVASLLGIWIIGVFVDRYLRMLTLIGKHCSPCLRLCWECLMICLLLFVWQLLSGACLLVVLQHYFRQPLQERQAMQLM